MNTSFLDESLLKYRTQYQDETQYQFYMRQIERNLILCHQKSKRHNRNSFSQTKAIPLHYKSSRQTAIDFEQIAQSKITQPISRENNGQQLFKAFEQARIIENRTAGKRTETKLSKELDKKMAKMKACIQEKKGSKKNEGKKENKLYKRMQREQQTKMMMNFGMIKPLKTGNRVGDEFGGMALDYNVLSKIMGIGNGRRKQVRGY